MRDDRQADVFLAARTLGDLQRNAMVSVFLRLLEHHQGVLLLTTNNVRHIDEAFLSRFSLSVSPSERPCISRFVAEQQSD